MENRTRQYLVSLLLILLANAAAAQSSRTAHTLNLDDPDARPPATIEEVAWIAGSWTGEALGGTFEEVWNPPSAGSMVGMFKHMDDAGVSFYELMLFVEEEGSLSLKIRHFDPDFTAWEEKDEDVTLRFITADEDAVHFTGLSFYRISDNEMHGWLVFGSGDTLREEKLVYRRNAD